GPPVCGNEIVVSNVPRVPEPDVAVTKRQAARTPGELRISRSNVASNVFAVPETRNGLVTVCLGSGDSTTIAGVTSSKSARVIAGESPIERVARTPCTVGNCVNV